MSAKKSSAKLPVLPEPSLEKFWEGRVAAEFGVSRPKISALRRKHLQLGAEWTMDGNAVVLTAAGLARMKDLLKARGVTALPPKDAPELKETPLAGPPERLKVAVARLCPNKKLMMCRRVADGPDAVALLVRVKENLNFMPGMLLEVVNTGPNAWQFTGRLPRRKGRW